MNERKRLVTRIAVLLLALVALGVWFVVGQGGRSESAGHFTVIVTDSPDPVVAGGMVTYTITVTNNGATAQPAMVDDTMTPSSPATMISAVTTQGTCDPPTLTTVHCSLDPIPPNATATITVKKIATRGVGGVLEFVDPSELRAPTAASPLSSTEPPLAAIAGGITLAVALVAAGIGLGSWYVRRRRSG